MTTLTTTTAQPNRSGEDAKSIKLFNPNHDPHTGEFSSGGGSGGSEESGEKEHGGGNPHRHPLTGRYSTSTERLQARIEEVRAVHAAAAARYDAARAAIAHAAREYHLSPAHQAAHAAAVRAADQPLHDMLDAQRQYYSLHQDLTSRRFGEGHYRFIPADPKTTEDTAAAMREIFGRELTVDEMGDLASATHGDELHVTPRQFRGAWRMEVISASHDWRAKGDITNGSRYTWRDIIKSPTTGRIRIINQYNRDATPDRLREPGAGTKRLARQVETAGRLGVSHLETHAAGNAHWASQGKKQGFNGYYTWARLGYNARLSGGYHARLPESLRSATTIGSLMRSKEGRDWWKANGGDWTGKFDLKPGSYSRQTLNAYMQAKGYRFRDLGDLSALLLTEASAAPTAPDRRRITEQDADFRRLHARIERALWRGIRAYVRALQSEPASAHAKAASAFIAHQTKALHLGYLAGHWEGERDYWHAFSAKHSIQAHTSLSQAHDVAPDVQRMRRALMFYAAGSVTKMAREAQHAWAADQRAKIATPKLAEKPTDSITLDDAANSAMNAWLGGLTARVALSADIAWTGLQDGYLAAGTVDPANPYALVWWQMTPTAQHCGQCPDLAAASPFTAPGAGGNELPQTPGDGGTDCGAGCKCTLQYGSDLMAPSTWAAPPGADDWMQQRAAAIADALQPSASAGPASQDAWERNRQAQIADALGGMGQRAPATQQPDAWELNRQRQIAEALRQRGQFGPHYPPMPPEPPAGIARGDEAVWQRIAEALTPGAPISEEEARQQIANAPIDGQLTEGQKQALDLYRKAALAWDKVRGALPPLDLFHQGEEWQTVNFETLTPEQIDAYAYYIEALREWADSTPMDQMDE